MYLCIYVYELVSTDEIYVLSLFFRKTKKKLHLFVMRKSPQSKLGLDLQIYILGRFAGAGVRDCVGKVIY